MPSAPRISLEAPIADATSTVSGMTCVTCSGRARALRLGASLAPTTGAAA